ncbi:MAG: 30S ribosomal protein S20 [Candidatus Marinimicrobia bacterium]|nr:30S ribosomal protein S20 [Candidatus Neomarinimicrobiota bacterium]|tara:strand:+ start:74 stop:328 length:255 start_codon:yes stop_codon:yes gene_type:complete
MSAKGTVLKRVRQSRKANIKNKHYKSIVKSVTKKVLNENKKDEAIKIVDSAFSTIDKVASKGIIHKNKAANQKARISKHLNNLK